MTIEEKAKRYDDAIKRAEEYYKEGKTLEYADDLVSDIFPEVRESDNENKPNGAIVMEDFNEGNGYYKVNLAYLNKEQVEEIETLVSKWNPTDEDIKSCIGMCLTDANEQRFKDYGTNLRDCLNWLEKQGEQNPAWSDEDEKMYTATIFALAGFMGNEDKLDWLKSLKDRVQPKQEWSEEDEKHYQGCLNLMKLSLDTKPYPYYNDYLWLKSLRPQSTWKPSNEQMLAIDTAINVLGKGTLNGKQLIELQEQLKKLREE